MLNTEQLQRGDDMATDEAAIVKRARELCKQDGFAWDLEYEHPSAEPVIPGIILSEESRQQYLARARAELTSPDRGA